MRAIVSVTDNWGIGYKGNLLVPNRADMRFFRLSTTGGTVIVGRATFEGFPPGGLPKRRNIVVTRDESYDAKGAEVAHSIDEALALIKDDEPDTVWLIGGAQLYREMLPFVDTAFVTKNHVIVEADSFFEDLDADPVWELKEVVDKGITEAGVSFEICRYERI